MLFSAFACFLGVTALGQQWIAAAYGIEGDILAEVSRYLVYLFPTILLRTLFHYFAGLLTQNDQTCLVSVCAFVGGVSRLSLQVIEKLGLPTLR